MHVMAYRNRDSKMWIFFVVYTIGYKSKMFERKLKIPERSKEWKTMQNWLTNQPFKELTIKEVGYELKTEYFKEKYARTYHRHDNVGKVKYTISYFDGLKTHKDGSPFFDIACFSNKRKLQSFINKLEKTGYIYKSF